MAVSKTGPLAVNEIGGPVIPGTECHLDDLLSQILPRVNRPLGNQLYRRWLCTIQQNSLTLTVRG